MKKKIIRIAKRMTTAFFLKAKNALGFRTTIFKLKSGQVFRIRNIDKIGIQLFNDESFERTVRDAILSKVAEGMTVVDIGANIGYYSVLMAGKVGPGGRVIAFEPNPSVFEELKANVKLNDFANVESENIAIADQNGVQRFFMPLTGSEAHGSLRQNETFAAAQSIDVKTERLDDVLERLKVQAVDLIKIDVEGAEMAIFEGAGKLLGSDRKPTIVFECAENLCKAFGHRVYDVLSYLHSFGYSLEEVYWGIWLAVPVDSERA